MEALTLAQTRVLRHVERCIADGLPPTRIEICRELGFASPNAAEEHLKRLAEKGYLQLMPGISRGIRLRKAYP